MNGFDRGNRERAVRIHEALSRASLPTDMILYRGGGDAILGALAGKSDQEIIGAAFKDRGFVSTSKDPNEAFSGNTKLEIYARAGSPAASVRTISQVPYEDEVLIDCGRIFVVKAVRYEGGKRIVSVEMM